VRAILFAVLALGGIIVISVLIAAVVSEPGGGRPNMVGVTISDEDVHAISCAGTPIASLELQRGSRPDGALVWKASRSSGPARDDIPIIAVVPGFNVSRADLPLDAEQSYAIRVADAEPRGSLLRSYLVFQPRQLRPGFVRTSSGADVPIAEWRSGRSHCR
jgi:hypothetical protein